MPYRLILMPLRTPQSPWRETREEAVQDAVALKLATPDEHVAKRLWWHPLAEIEEGEQEGS